MMKLLKKRLLSRKGFSYVLTSVMILVIMLITVAVFEVIRLNIQAEAVRNKFQEAIIASCVDNYTEVYQPVRDGYAAGYGNTGTGWNTQNNTMYTNIESYLKDAMNDGEIMQCNIDFMTFEVTHGDNAPSYTPTSEKFAVNGEIWVEIPYRFAWSELVPISLHLTVKSQWRAKF